MKINVSYKDTFINNDKKNMKKYIKCNINIIYRMRGLEQGFMLQRGLKAKLLLWRGEQGQMMRE